MHLIIRKEDIDLVPGPPATNAGLRRALLIGGHTGATHTGLSLIEMRLETSAPGLPDRHSYRFERGWEYPAERLRDGA